MRQSTTPTIGMDIGDRKIEVCTIGTCGGTSRTSLATDKIALQGFLESLSRPARVVIEACSHSPWISRLITATGHEAIVANPRCVSSIAKSDYKNDRNDAEQLARIGRFDPQLLRPIHHRGERAHRDRMLITARETVVAQRTQMINKVRNLTKTIGVQLPRCSTPSFAARMEALIPTELHLALVPLLQVIERLNEVIKTYDRRIAELAEDYPEINVLSQVPGVGPLTSSAFVLTVEDPQRFKSNRSIGPFLGLTPRQRDSSSQHPQLRISKAGSPLLRRLLVICAQHILTKKSPDTDLKRAGLAIAARGGKNAKKRSAVAVARRLAVLLLKLWRTGEVYDPLRNAHRKEQQAPRVTVA